MRRVGTQAANAMWGRLLEALPVDARIGFVTERYAEPSERLRALLTGLRAVGTEPQLVTAWPGTLIRDVEDAIPRVLTPPTSEAVQILLSLYPSPLLSSNLATGEPRDWHVLRPDGGVWLGSTDCNEEIWIDPEGSEDEVHRLLATL